MAGTSYTRQSTFDDGDVITAALFNNEYNQLLNAFVYASSGTTGHQHDGGAGEGGNIETIGDQDFLNKLVVDSTNNRWGFFVEVSSSAVEQVRIQDGAIVPVTDNDIDLGTSSLEFKDAYFDGTVTTDALVADTADINGGTVDGATIGASSATTIVGTTITANTAFVPDASDGAALGTASLEFSDLYLADGAIIYFGDDQDINITHVADTGLTTNGTFQSTTITATTAFVPDASDGAALGTSALEFSDLYLADGAVVYFGDDQDVSLTHVADTGLLLSSTDQLQFGDSGTYIHQSADGVLDLVSDTEIELTATTVDINGAVDVSGEIIAASLDISGNVDIDGTTNLDAVDIDGAVQIDGATTFGVDDTGVDVKFFGDTASAYLLWDTSADKLLTAGGAVVDIVKDKLLIGGTAVTTTAAELNILDGKSFVDEDDLSSDSATAIASQQSIKAYVDANVSSGDMNNWILEDGDGTEVTISNAKEVKFVEGGGVDINWTDTDNGTDGDPYDLTFTINAAQTGITSIYATDLILGEDSQTAIDFGTANEIDFKVDNAARLTLTASALYPVTDNQIDLGTSSLEFKDAFFDGTVTADAFAGPLTGDVTGNASGTAATVTGAAQSNITSLGTLTTLTVDNVIINGSTIGHTGDTDLMTVASGILTVAGEVSMTTLDIGGTNVTSTAAELNILDGVTSTAAELNILDGVTSTAAELNILDGVTSTAAELNILDGVTATTAELNYLDITTLGTTAASKAVTADANGVVKFAAGIAEKTVALTSGTTVALDINDGTIFTITLAHNIGTFNWSNPGSGSVFALNVTQDGTGSRTIAWPAGVKWAGDEAPTLSTGAADVDTFVFLHITGTVYYGFTAGQDMS